MSEQEERLRELQQVDEMLQHIEDLMANEEYDKAQDLLNTALRSRFFDIRIYQRYAFILRMLELDKGAEVFESCVMNPGDPEAFYRVAHTLMGEKLFGPAINPLFRVIELVPMASNAVFELGYCMMKEFHLEESLDHFKHAHEMAPSPNTAFYVGYISLMLKDLETAKSVVPFIAQEYEKSEQEPVTLNILKAMIERYEAFPPRDNNLRDWHFVQYGTPLLRTSTEDLEKESELNGRYVFINYGFLNLAIVLETFRRMVEEVPGFTKFDYIIPTSIKAAPLAFALSKMIDVPLASPQAIESDLKGLIVTTWSNEVDNFANRIAHNPNITLFSFALGFTQQAALCPEMVGYLDQANRMPWEETVQVTETGERQHRPAMTETPEEIAQLILGRLEAVSREEVDRVIEYYQERAHLLKVGDNINQPRLGFQIESPVQSLRMFV
ncbi:tetratricopeptide repeat protein [Tumebacillus lipolyticus]|uniref:Tetratricopeptide repeat protein n=1 Tax=Tumebacillus lipolyticus TaxID=1280370 RepID=A0ABW5A1M3_9BACL